MSSVSKSSRYNGTQGASIQVAPEFRTNLEQSAAKLENSESQKTILAFRNTGNLRAQTDVKNYGAPLKVEYFSDEEEEQ